MGGTHARDTDGFPDEDDRSGLYPIEGERWYLCDYCGWFYPESETAIEEATGLRACLRDPGDYNDLSEDPDWMRAQNRDLLFTWEDWADE